MALRADYREEFSARFLPQIADAAEGTGFAQVQRAGKQWVWARQVSDGVRAEILLSEMTGREVRQGIDLQGYGAIFVDEVERRLRERGPRHLEAATLMAPLRAWGATFTHDSWYRLRWNTDPGARVDALIGDVSSFARFASGVDDVTDLSSARLARSRIRKHVVSGLAPNYTIAEVAALIDELNGENAHGN